MTLKVNIIKTADGYNYRNADKDSNKLIGTVHKSANKAEMYYVETYDHYDALFGTLEQSHKALQQILAKRAANLGMDIEFNEI